jgi:hypothetical protein
MGCFCFLNYGNTSNTTICVLPLIWMRWINEPTERFFHTRKPMDIFRTRLETMKSKCVHHQDDRYWNILDHMTPNENPRENLEKTSTWNCLELDTKDGFHIKIIFWYTPPLSHLFKRVCQTSISYASCREKVGRFEVE